MERYILRVGEFETPVVGELREAMSTPPKAEVVARREDLEAKAFDWAEDAWLYDDLGEAAGSLRMTARVLRVLPRGDDVTVELVSPLEFEMTDTLLSAKLSALPIADALWAVLGPTGFRREDLRVSGSRLDEFPLERFRVAIPGVGSTTLAEIVLPDATVIAPTEPLGYLAEDPASDLEAAYVGPRQHLVGLPGRRITTCEPSRFVFASWRRRDCGRALGVTASGERRSVGTPTQ